MKKAISIALILSLIMLGSAILTPAFAMPTIKRPGELITATIEGGNPETVDPAWAYDTASAEIIFNVYDNLITFDGEHMETFISSLATNWTITPISETSPEGLHWYYRYNFTIRTGVLFQDGSPLTPADVEYSIERGMVQDRNSGPQWMFFEPLFYTAGSAYDLGSIGNSTNPGPDVGTVGKMIDHAVGSSSTNVWFNLAFPGAYAPFMQILAQSWGCILSKHWITTYVIGTLSRPDWSGNWMLGGDHVDWINYHDPLISPLDDPTPIMMGSGPFSFETLDYTAKYWSLNRYAAYWGGWPARFPYMAGAGPTGYIVHFVTTWAYVWETRSVMFTNGDVDFCAVPRAHINEIIGLDGIRMIWPLPGLTVDGLFYTFNISPLTAYGPIYSYGDFSHNDGIPRDFFGGAGWGIHIRKAFSYAFDYNTYLSVAYLGEAIAPATAIIPGLSYYDSTVQGYNYNLTRAAQEFAAANTATGGALNTNGFTITLLYNAGNLPRQTACNLLKAAIESINPTKYHVTVTSMDWSPYLKAARAHQLAIYVIGWLADYPDPHNFAYPFYHTGGAFSIWQLYSNSTMDALIDAGILAPDGAGRALIYHNIQVLAVADVPSVMIDQAIGRHFERDWVVGWYYNIIYTGTYAHNLWKHYYVEEAAQSTAAQPYSSRLPIDVNYDYKIDMKDIGVTAHSFGASYGPPIHERWIYRCDFDNNRLIDMKDIGRVAKGFGQNSLANQWVAPVRDPHDIAASIDVTRAGGSITTFNVTKYPTVNIVKVISNVGLNTENTTLKMSINGTLIETEYNTTLAATTSNSFTYAWSPATPTGISDTYVITAVCSCMPDAEINHGNNFAQITILVTK